MKRPKNPADNQGDIDRALEAVHDVLDGAEALLEDQGDLETTGSVKPRIIVRRPIRRNLTATKTEELEAFLTSLPKRGESLHIVSNGTFDYFQFLPVCLKLLGRTAAEFYWSTWTMNRDNVGELLSLFDRGRIQKVSVLTGTYFKRRESAVATTLIEGLAARRQRYVAFQNHTKVMLLGAAPDWIVMEGSANFTANPRLEQTVLSNDRKLYDFHKRWMEDMLSTPQTR